jgi:putative lipoic acid-binding regulatory protein
VHLHGPALIRRGNHARRHGLRLRGRYAMTDTEVKAPKIEFPQIDYPVKVISDTGVGNKDKIIEIVKKHATINDERVDERQSTNGKYTTIQLHIVATDQDQLYNINSELRATGFVHMVL